jgi:deoxyribodipyrimidine photo-lyase
MSPVSRTIPSGKPVSRAIWWIRRDLRLSDNPALAAALAHGKALALYIHAPDEEHEAAPGAAARWWLHHSLTSLSVQLRTLGVPLLIRHGRAALPILRAVLAQTGTEAVFWTRQYAPAQRRRDEQIKAELGAAGVRARSFNGSLLFEPWQVLRDRDQPYRVFTPFWKACLKHGIDQPILPAPASFAGTRDGGCEQAAIDALQLLPRAPDWSGGLAARWTPGSPGAQSRLAAFVDEDLAGYTERRDRPGVAGTSSLSPHLHFGEISPRQVVRAVLEARGGVLDGDAEHFLRELGWREFSHHLLFHFPHTVEQPLDARFARFAWPPVDESLLRAWQRGRTGIPLVDAGMRELWHTGWMHNRVRMIVASFLAKNLLIPWQHGERWFRDTLVDADLANNVLGWQWTAGCGADAAPYFRVFNPVLQGERFDLDGAYVRRWVPELAAVPTRWLHRPWEAPPDALRPAAVRLGVDYPLPLVDLAATRARALEHFAALKSDSDRPDQPRRR